MEPFQTRNNSVKILGHSAEKKVKNLVDFFEYTKTVFCRTDIVLLGANKFSEFCRRNQRSLGHVEQFLIVFRAICGGGLEKGLPTDQVVRRFRRLADGVVLAAAGETGLVEEGGR